MFRLIEEGCIAPTDDNPGTPMIRSISLTRAGSTLLERYLKASEPEVRFPSISSYSSTMAIPGPRSHRESIGPNGSNASVEMDLTDSYVLVYRVFFPDNL